jgi:hypothetical protein
MKFSNFKKKISKGIYTILIFLICFLMISLSSLTAQIKVIYETDMDTDIDDASALGMLHALADNGVVDLLAVMHNTSDHYGPGYIDVVNTFYGRPNLPIGSYKRDDAVSRDIGNLHTSARPGAKYNNCPEYVHRIVLDPRFHYYKHNRDDLPSANVRYKEILSKQENHSVTIISVGYLLNLEYLIRDSLGLELVKQKVNHVVVLGGNWLPKNERHVMGMNLGGNQINTRAGMATMYVLDNWPTPIHFSSNRISKKYFLGDNLKNTPENNPIREAYKIYKPEKPTWNHHLADLTAVYYTVYSETKPEEWILDSVGTPQAGFAFKPIPHLYNIWNTSKDSQHLLWKLKDDKFEEVSMRIAELMIQPPRKKK